MPSRSHPASAIEKAPVTKNTKFVVISEADFETMKDCVNFLKGWSMHTEGGDYEGAFDKLVHDRVQISAIMGSPYYQGGL